MELRYTVDDDHAAIEAVGAEINRPDPARWQAMTTGDDRLRQTYRVRFSTTPSRPRDPIKAVAGAITGPGCCGLL